MLTAGALAALWSLYDLTGIRPEYLIPVLWHESGFDPSIANRLGSGHYGIAQTSGSWLVDQGIDPQDFLTWSDETQIRAAVIPHFRDVVTRYGSIRSGARVYQANFLPVTLPRVRTLVGILASRGSPYYRDNPTLDPYKHGAIMLSDLAAVVSRDARRADVQRAIAAAYAQRPDESPRSPAYGDDFLDPRWWLLAPVAVGAYAVSRSP